MSTTTDRAAWKALKTKVRKTIGEGSRGASTDDGPALDHGQRLAVVNNFLHMLDGVYAHLPQKRAMYGQDPVQRLRLLEQHLRNTAVDGAMNNAEFHRRMAEILTELRDSHTRYIIGARDALLVDALPLLVEHYTEPSGQSGYIVSRLVPLDDDETARFAAAGFVAGVLLTHWNAVPIARAIDLHAERETGGRPEARRARALESLTLRPRYFALRPDADWVNISFETLDGHPAEVRLDWRCIETDRLPEFDTDRPADFARAINPVAESARRVKKMLFATRAWFEEDGLSTQESATRPINRTARAGMPHTLMAPGVRRFARNVDVARHKFDGIEYGHLRIWSFNLVDDDGFIAEVRALLDDLPPNGLIVDLRSNPGGLIWAAERTVATVHASHDRTDTLFDACQRHDPSNGECAAQYLATRGLATLA